MTLCFFAHTLMFFCFVLFFYTQAPQLLWPALKGAGRITRAWAHWRTASPVWEDFTVIQLASPRQVDSAVEGTSDSVKLRKLIFL